MAEREDLELTEAILFELAEIVAKGNFRHVAAGQLGITPNTLHGWVRRGKTYLEDYNKGKLSELTLQARLVVELEKAEADCHGKLVVDILASGSPELKLKFLRLRYNKLYNNNPNAVDDVTGEDVQRSAADLLIEKLSTFLEDE